MEREHTVPPCISCDKHDELEDEFVEMKNSNKAEHTEIQASLKWMLRIGSALVTGIGVIFFMVWTLHSGKHLTEKAVIEIQSDIKYIGIKIDENLKHQQEVKTQIYKEIEICQDKKERKIHE